MNIQILSMSHKTAPVAIRALFAFTEEKSAVLADRLLQEKGIRECVILSTCNRTEIYTASDQAVPVWQVMTVMQQVMTAGVPTEERADVASMLRLYQGSQAVRHLFLVAAGLDSQVIGEDQILGQVKAAHQQAMSRGHTGAYLNVLFRMAVTAAKRVKTETGLSAVSVSTASLAVKAAETYLGSLDQKTVVVIGASGRIGSIVMKNILSAYAVTLYATSRQMAAGETRTADVCSLADSHCSGRHYRTGNYTQVSYADRYHYMCAADVIISATASPHYTITKEQWTARISGGRRRILIDMAVPMDIEDGIGDGKETQVFRLDELQLTADQNQVRRQAAADQAREMLNADIAEYERWFLFREYGPLMAAVRERLTAGESASTAKTIDQWFYRVREAASPEQLKVFYEVLAQAEKEG